jgi:hypothetical protein
MSIEKFEALAKRRYIRPVDEAGAEASGSRNKFEAPNGYPYRRLLLVDARQPDKATTAEPRGSLALMPRGIAAHYAASTAPTSEPTPAAKKPAFWASAISEARKLSR